MSLERKSVALSWCLLTLAVLPALLAVVYWVSLFVPLFTPGDRWPVSQGAWIVLITVAMLLLGVISLTGWKIMSRLRRAVDDREAAGVQVWLGSLGYNLILLALSLSLPWPLGWHEDDGSPLLAFLLYGLPAMLAVQVWLAVIGWWQARSAAETTRP